MLDAILLEVIIGAPEVLLVLHWPYLTEVLRYNLHSILRSDCALALLRLHLVA